MPEGLSEMSRFSKVSSIFGRDAFATMRYVTLLNVSEIRDISNDERKVPFKNDEYLASGTSSSERHVNQSSETTKFRNHCEKSKTSVLLYITAISYQLKTNCGKAIAIVS